MSALRQPRVRKFIASETPINIIDAMTQLFPAWFSGPSWNPWRVVLRAAFGLPMSEEEIEFFKTIAGGREPPTKRVRELWCVCGRRSGKSAIVSLIAAFSSIFFRVGLDKLRPGERALVQALAVDKSQAKVVHGFIASYFDLLPPLRSMIHRRTAETLELCNDVDVVTATNSFRSVRGRTILVSVLDEVAYWRDENSAAPDVETYNALRPSLMTLQPNSMLVGISSPYRKGGLLYTKWKQHFGIDDPDVLVIQAPSIVMNPTLDEKEIAKAVEADPQAARSEWLGLFRDDITNFVDPEVVAACVSEGVRELPPVRGVQYFGFADPSGGSSDSMTLAIAYRDGPKVCIACVRERRPPFSPEDVCAEFSGALRAYNNIGTIQSDKYAGSWVVEAFARHGVRVEQSAKPKSDLYVDLLSLLNSRRIELLDHPRTAAQLVGLERRVGRSGKDSIDHQPGGHDDLANCVAGVAQMALGHQGVHVDAALLARVQALPPRRFHAGRRVGRIMFSQPPAEEQGYPSSLLPPRGDQVS